MRMNAMIALAAGTMFLAACGPREADDVLDSTEAAGSVIPGDSLGMADSGVTVADITDNPDNYVGRTVTVEADLEEVHSPMAFTLDEDDMLRGGIDNDLLVFSRQAGGLEHVDDQWIDNKVRVTGVVQRFTVVELEREVGWDLNREIEAEVEGRRLVLIANSISRVNR
jgi:hypothetical protein